MAKRIAKASLNFTGLYESELLVELMLRYWQHPRAAEAEFRNDILEAAAEALRSAVGGEVLIAGLPADQMNLVSAIWCAECNRIASDGDVSASEKSDVERWLTTVRRSLPACFCDHKYLD